MFKCRSRAAGEARRGNETAPERRKHPRPLVPLPWFACMTCCLRKVRTSLGRWENCDEEAHFYRNRWDIRCGFLRQVFQQRISHQLGARLRGRGPDTTAVHLLQWDWRCELCLPWSVRENFWSRDR